MLHTINIILLHQQKQVHDLAIASLSHACIYHRTLVGSFLGVKTILRYAYSFCSETPIYAFTMQISMQMELTCIMVIWLSHLVKQDVIS